LKKKKPGLYILQHVTYRLNTINEGKVAVGDLSGFLPCTPNGVMELIRR